MSSGRIATTLVMLTIFSAMTVMALGFPQKAAFTPLVVGIPGVILCLAQLAVDLAGRTRLAGSGEGEDKELDGREAISAREWVMFLWLAVFTAAIVGFGFHVGGSLVVLLYVRFGEGEPWRNAVLAGGGTFLVLWLVFTRLLELPLFDGFLLPRLF
jgi:hypothetical protein